MFWIFCVGQTSVGLSRKRKLNMFYERPDPFLMVWSKFIFHIRSQMSFQYEINLFSMFDQWWVPSMKYIYFPCQITDGFVVWSPITDGYSIVSFYLAISPLSNLLCCTVSFPLLYIYFSVTLLCVMISPLYCSGG